MRSVSRQPGLETVAGWGRFEICRTVVTAAKIITKQNTPVSAEKTKRLFMTTPKTSL
jgi:hypothetical protein